ncbi:cytochrome P450 [Rhodocollybia butyracea]|uniref:Cytochrome P450 n=1 Tax=Rhodocollybia butyracea TaxID=206335 RepID=A0A9P5PAG7_9AGAR|nr:cytochrome P450 [Rhodocollybia butyracea]
MLILIAKVVLVLVFVATAYILSGIVYRHYKRSLAFLRGPPKTSLLFGLDYELQLQEEFNGLESQWYKEYGTAYRGSTYYGEDMLMVSDPKALLYICNASGYRFPKPQDVRHITQYLMGSGITTVEDQVHNRQRKVLNPAFSAKQLRQFLELFQSSTKRLAAKWQQECDTSKGAVLNVCKWLPRITLDVIGESAFSYEFGSLKGEENELGVIFEHLFVDSRVNPGKWRLLYRSLRGNLPDFVGNFLVRFPSKEERRFLGFLNASKRVARPLFKRASDGTAEKDTKDSKDVLSILVQANQQMDPKKALDEDEVLSQMAVMILAGHETTASTFTLLMHQLAKNPKDQERLYQEIQEVRERIGEQDPSPQDLDSMPFFNAVIKEILRLYPIVPTLIRQARSDDAIPLEFPVTTVSGDVISSIPVSKGQRVTLHLAMYNRLPQVWGGDADQWNPERFLDTKKRTSLGVYANLMSFSSGLRGCIGWRFAVMELQAILFGLLEKFEFSPPSSGELDEIQLLPFGLITPLRKGKWHEGKQLPIFVKSRN